MPTSVVLLHVVPSIGNLLASLMLVSPVAAVMRLRATGKLGDVNPLPLPLTAYNAMGWLAYGLVTSNPYLFPSNFIGFVAGMFFTLTAHASAPRRVADRILGIMLLGSAHFITMAIIALFGLTQPAAERMWGVNGIVILMVYYIVPLSTMYDIIKKKNANSIYTPLAMGAVANGGLWAVYGFALKDVNLWLPNLFGAVIGIVQLALRFVYGAVPDPAPGTPGSNPVPPGKGAEAPEEHPAAKHPGAKETRRPSILALLHPSHHHSHEDVERRAGSATNLTAVAASNQAAAAPAKQGQTPA